jgi:NADPH:quinone reductase-like Zn-dependent oxidoreductase
LKKEDQQNMLDNLAELVDAGKIKSHLTKRLKLTASGLREAHRLIESSATIGKIGLGVDEDGPGEAFA